MNSVEYLSPINLKVQSPNKATMAECVTCHKPLTLYIEPDDIDEVELTGATVSADTGSHVDDDVQLQCGCHFHWSVSLSYTGIEKEA